MKKLLILGGTRISCEIVRKAKKMGVYTVVTDYYDETKSPAKQIADESFLVSCTDVDAVVSLIKEQNIDGVLVGFNDLLLPYYADICDKAGLPCYGTKKQFEVFIDKKKYKALMREHNVPTIKEYTIDNDDLQKSSEQIDYPVLVKPSDSSGARGITICHNKGEFIDAYEKAMSFSKEKEVLVEEYLDGEEATIFWVFDDGNYNLCGIGNRHVKENQEGVIPLPVGYTYPSRFTKKYQDEVEENTKEMFRSAGIKNGMMFMQAKVKDGTLVVYDIGYRLTGSLEYKNINAVCGYYPLEMMINFALTGKMTDKEVKYDPYFNGLYPYNVSCLVKPGTIAEIKGIEEVKSLPGVIDAVIAHYPGETITEEMRGLLTQITVRVLGTVKNKDELIPTMKKINDLVRVYSTDGIDMRLSGIEDEDIEFVE